MRKICVITGTRAEYGLMRWIMQGIKDDSELTLQIIATGMRLSPEFGLTCREIFAAVAAALVARIPVAHVHGIKRRASLFNTDRIDHLYRGSHEAGVRFFLHPGELNDWQPPIKNYSWGLTH